MRTKTKILLIEDETPIRQMLSFALKRVDYDIIEATSIIMAWKQLEIVTPDLVLLDWMLPDKSGVSFLTELRQKQKFENIPVIMLTARAEESNKLRAFAAGADDYITKPFSPKELLARIFAVLKRSKGTDDKEDIVSYGNIILNIDEHSLIIDEKPIKIGPLEFKLLSQLIQYQGKVLSREALLNRVWGDEKEVSERTVDVHIRRVRQLLEPSKNDILISSIRGIGYKFA